MKNRRKPPELLDLLFATVDDSGIVSKEKTSHRGGKRQKRKTSGCGYLCIRLHFSMLLELLFSMNYITPQLSGHL
jgi:hypothetical protein